MNVKLLFLNPPFKPEHGRFSREQRSPAITKGGTFYYPIWLCYAAAVLQNDGFCIKIIDAPARRMTYEQVEQQAAAYAPNIIVVDTSTPSIVNDVGIADQLKEITGAFTVLVGTHPSALPTETLRMSNRVDAIARKEYDYTIRDIARAIARIGVFNEKSLRSIPGLTFRIGDEIVHNSDREFIKDLDEIPFVSKVYHDYLDVNDYFYTIAQYPQVAIFSARGCPHRCVYCVYPQVMHGRAYRTRSVQNLIEEFLYIERELPQVREIFIEDDTFTVSARRIQEFAAAYRSNGLKISWVANSRADIDFDTLRKLKSCNCRLLCVGFESGDQSVLDAMGKNLKIEKARQFVKDANKAGLIVHGCFLFGNPGESKETLERTLRYAKELRLDTAQFFPIMVYPGTEAYNWAVKEGFLLTEDFSRWNTEEGLHNCVVSRPNLTQEELVAFCDKARREFYLRPAYISYRLARLILHPLQDWRRFSKSFKTFRKFLFRGTFSK
jgi:anaerobic magnesium-protoporphyrin IX monomethyl ester cyclase